MHLPFSDPHPWPDVDLNPRTSPPPAGFTTPPAPGSSAGTHPRTSAAPLVNTLRPGEVRMQDPLHAIHRAHGVRAARPGWTPLGA